MTEQVTEEKKEEQATLNGIMDAVKELTKVIGKLQKEWETFRKAGRF